MIFRFPKSANLIRIVQILILISKQIQEVDLSDDRVLCFQKSTNLIRVVQILILISKQFKKSDLSDDRVLCFQKKNESLCRLDYDYSSSSEEESGR